MKSQPKTRKPKPPTKAIHFEIAITGSGIGVTVHGTLLGYGATLNDIRSKAKTWGQLQCQDLSLLLAKDNVLGISYRVIRCARALDALALCLVWFKVSGSGSSFAEPEPAGCLYRALDGGATPWVGDVLARDRKCASERRVLDWKETPRGPCVSVLIDAKYVQVVWNGHVVDSPQELRQLATALRSKHGWNEPDSIANDQEATNRHERGTVAVFDYSQELGRHSSHYFDRRYLREDLESFCEKLSGPGGYWLVLAPPLFGKTAFAAHLLSAKNRARRVVGHLFNRIQGPKWTNLPDGFRSVIAQLQREFPGIEVDSRELVGEQFRQALRGVSEVVASAGQHQLVVLDGLDEADAGGPREELTTLLPRELPAGIVVALLGSPDDKRYGWLLDGPRCRRLRAVPDPGAHEEILDFLQTRDKDLGLALPADSIERLAEASQGLLGLAAWHLDPRRAGFRDDLRLWQKDPSEVRISRDFHAWLKEQWARLLSRTDKEGLRPSAVEAVLGILALAKEPLSEAQVNALINAARGDWEKDNLRPLESFQFEDLAGNRVRDVLRLARELFDPLDLGQGECRAGGRFYHYSLPEFILGSEERSDVLTPVQTDDLRRVLAAATMCVWREPKNSARGYALRHMPGHLVQARRHAELADLLLNLEFLHAKITESGGTVYDLLADLELLESALGSVPPCVSSKTLEALASLSGALQASTREITERPERFLEIVHQQRDWSDSPIAEHMETQLAVWNPVCLLRRVSWPPHEAVVSPLRTLEGSRGTWSLTFSPDNQLIAGVNSQAGVCVWDGRGRLKLALAQSRHAANGVLYSPSGVLFSRDGLRRLVTWVDMEGWIRRFAFWSADDGQRVGGWFECKRPIIEPTERHFAPDGALFGMASEAGIAMLDVAQGILDQVLTPSRLGGPVGHLAFSPDGHWLAFGSHDGIEVWKRQKEMAFHRHISTPKGLAQLRFCGGELLAVQDDLSLVVFDVANGKRTELSPVIPPPGGDTYRRAKWIELSPDGDSLLWEPQGRDGVGEFLCCWFWKRGVVRLLDHPDRDPVNPNPFVICRFARRAGIIALASLGSAESDVRVTEIPWKPGDEWDCENGISFRQLRTVALVPYLGSLALSPGGRVVATCGQEDRRVRLWDARGTPAPSIPDAAPSLVNLPPEGAKGATLAFARFCRVILQRCGECLADIHLHEEIRDLAFSGDGGAVGALTESGKVFVFDTVTGRNLCHGRRPVLTLPRAVSIAFSPDGRIIAAVDDKGRIDRRFSRFKDDPAGDRSPCLCRRSGRIAYSPNGTRVISVAKGVLTLWQGGEDTLLEPAPLWRVEVGKACHVAWSPDGTMIAAAGGEGVWVWGVSEGMIGPCKRLRMSAFEEVVFSPRGDLAARSQCGEEVWLWTAQDLRIVVQAESNAALLRSLQPSVEPWISANEIPPPRPDDGRQFTWPGGWALCIRHREAEIRRLVFTDDGRLLATADATDTCLWDVQSGGLLATANVSLAILAVSFSGSRLLRVASLSSDNSVFVSRFKIQLRQ